MERHRIEPRPDWQRTVEEQGLIYPLTRYPDDSLRPYWDESAYYRFSLAEIEALEATVDELHALCLDGAGSDGFRRAGRTCWIEPAWKMLLSNKALLAVLWELNWTGDGEAAGLGIRESAGPVTDEYARFLPHVIID